MNTNYIFLILLLFLGSSECNRTSTQKPKVLSISFSNEPVIVRYNRTVKKINRIRLPFNIRLSNTTSKDINLVSLRYEYSSFKKGVQSYLYSKNRRVDPSNVFVLESNSYNNYLMYTSHFIDSASKHQNKLKTILDKFSHTNKDTLHFNNLALFYKKYSSFLYDLTYNDSIKIEMLDSNYNIDSIIKIPVEY